MRSQALFLFVESNHSNYWSTVYDWNLIWIAADTNQVCHVIVNMCENQYV